MGYQKGIESINVLKWCNGLFYWFSKPTFNPLQNFPKSEHIFMNSAVYFNKKYEPIHVYGELWSRLLFNDTRISATTISVHLILYL